MDVLRLLLGDAKNVSERFLAIKILTILLASVYIYDKIGGDTSIFEDMFMFLTGYLLLIAGIPLIWMKKNLGLLLIAVHLIFNIFYAVFWLFGSYNKTFYLFIYEFIPLYASVMIIYYSGYKYKKLQEESIE